MAEKQDEIKYRNVREYDALDVNTLPDFRRYLNEIAADPGVDASTIQFVNPFPGAVRIVFQRVKKERIQ